jgi:hypothetical protein
MSASKGQTVFYTTKYDPLERSGTIEESTSIGYKINGAWYNRSEINIKNILLDSKDTSANSQLILG